MTLIHMERVISVLYGTENFTIELCFLGNEVNGDLFTYSHRFSFRLQLIRLSDYVTKEGKFFIVICTYVWQGRTL